MRYLRSITISSHFPDTCDDYVAMCSVLQKSFEKSVNSFKVDHLPNSDFTKCAEEFSKVKGKKVIKFNPESDLTEYLQLYNDIAK